jgi:hypothetical protein
MCQPDITPYTLRFLENSALPVGNRNVTHKCVNWGKLLEGMEKLRVDPFEKGAFVHPRFGKRYSYLLSGQSVKRLMITVGEIVPDGRDTVLRDRIGFTEDTEPLDIDKWIRSDHAKL